VTVVATLPGVVVLGERTPSNAVTEEVARASRCRLLGRVDSMRAVIDAARAHRLEVVVVEISTVERLREVAAGPLTGTGARLVVVSALPAEAALLTCMGAGARAFIRRPLEPGVVERAIAAVLAGDTFVDPRSTSWLVELALHGHRSRPRDGLTLRQSQVVELVRGGLTNREIARVLDVSLATVKSHLHEAMRRLGVGDRQSATVLAERLREDRP
jgi:DNA-binding NarL/FixJ family response regulator